MGQYKEDKDLVTRYVEAKDALEQSHPPYDNTYPPFVDEQARLAEAAGATGQRRLSRSGHGASAYGEDEPEPEDFLNAAMSNSWAVHGNYTESGAPLLANDFHMGADLPVPCTIGELRWGDTFVYGAMMPGIPGIINGRTKTFGWSMTIGLADSTDLWEEELSEDGTQYKVDGEWRNLTTIATEIPVAGKNTTVSHSGTFTHRGLLVDRQAL